MCVRVCACDNNCGQDKQPYDFAHKHTKANTERKSSLLSVMTSDDIYLRNSEEFLNVCNEQKLHACHVCCLRSTIENTVAISFSLPHKCRTNGAPIYAILYLSFSDVSCLPRDFSVSVSTNYCKFPVFLIRNSFVAAVRFEIASISNQVSGEKSTSPNANARTKQTHTHSIQSMSQHLFGSTSEFITCFVIKLPNHLKNNK